MAFEVLVRRHRTPVFNYIFRFTGDRARAEDILQETWLKVVRSAQDYEPKARFTTWVYTLARNLCVDRARREQLRQADSLDAPRPAFASQGDNRTPADFLVDPGPVPDRAAHNLRIQPLLERALLSLPEEHFELEELGVVVSKLQIVGEVGVHDEHAGVTFDRCGLLGEPRLQHGR